MSQTITRDAGPVRWQLLPALGPAEGDLFGVDGLRLAEWLGDGRARVVKQGPHQAVYRVVLPGLDFHLKEYRLPDSRARLRRLARGGKARLEFERALAAAQRGVPTAEPLAVGEGPDVGYLLTRTLPDAVPLHDFLELTLPGLPARRQPRLRRRLAVALGRFLALLHAAGVAHHDLHPGNLLLRLDAEDAPSLYLIDLYAADVGPPLDHRRRRHNLLVLNGWFALRSAPADRLRFWRAYERASGRDDVAEPTELERDTLRLHRRLWRQHDRRCVEPNRYFRPLRLPGAAGWAVTELEVGPLESLARDPDAPFERPGASLLKRSRGGAVIEVELPVGGSARRLICKRFHVTAWTDPWAALVRPTAAERSYRLGHGLRMRGLPTPRPLAFWHRTRRGLKREGYLLTEKVPDAVHLLNWLTALEKKPTEERRAALRRMIEQAARLVRDLHRRRLSHRDLKANNLLVSPQPWSLAHAVRARANPAAPPPPAGPPGAAQLWFIDLVGVRIHRRLDRRRKVQNLARLNASFHGHPGLTRTDRLRFLRVYLRWGLRGKRGWKEWWREVEAATRAKVERNRRSGRPLG
jgi:tRNA A-37 threonylcarbamoyl transferase component Bud32